MIPTKLHIRPETIRHLCVVAVLLHAVSTTAQPGNTTPVDFKIAFIGDQGVSNKAVAVLQLIRDEGAHAVIHSGDLDYKGDPARWETMINSVLGENFPYFVCVGNHDDNRWYDPGGYQERLEARMQRLGLSWDGDYGVQSAFHFQGMFIVLLAPDIFGQEHDLYLRQQLAADHSIWRIASWHKNMQAMQVGGKRDEAGWGVYREARLGGAIIATGHEHSYSRTHLLSSMENQIVASTSDTLRLSPGRTFAFVSGLGGKSDRDQERSGDWWASIYTSDQGARPGALFGVFNRNGEERLAEFYFKNIDGEIIDHFWVFSLAEDIVAEMNSETANLPAAFGLEQNYPNPFNPRTNIQFALPAAGPVNLSIYNNQGQRVRTLVSGDYQRGVHSITWDATDDSGSRVASGVYLYEIKANNFVAHKKLVLTK